MHPRIWHTALGLAGLVSVLAAPASAQESKIGVAAGVNPAATGIPPVSPPRTLYIGQEVVRDERVRTEPTGQAQLQFLDRTTLTIGPSSEVVLDKFVYSPATDTGSFAMTTGRGVMRLVGGAVSKREEATVTTPAAVIGIRGGVVLLDVMEAAPGQPAQTTATFLAGEYLRARATNGEEVIIRRPGFTITIIAGQSPRRPGRASLEDFERILSRLESRRGLLSPEAGIGLIVPLPGPAEGRPTGAPGSGSPSGRPPGAAGGAGGAGGTGGEMGGPGTGTPGIGTPGASGAQDGSAPGQAGPGLGTTAAGVAISNGLIASLLPSFGSDNDPAREAARSFDPPPAEGQILPPTLADISLQNGMAEIRRDTVTDLTLGGPPPNNGFFVPPLPPLPPPAVPPVPPLPPLAPN